MRLRLLLLAIVFVLASPTTATPGAVVEVASLLPSATYPGIIEFTFSCGTTATAIVPASDSRQWASLTCYVDGTTPVYFGGTSVTTSTGMPICEDAACANGGTGIYSTPVQRGSVGCIVSSGTVSIRCQGPSASRTP